jgi:hypothetical protein
MRVSVGDNVRPLLAAVMLLAGLVTAGFGAYDYLGQSDAVEDAVEVEATVLETEVEEVSKRRGGADYDPDVRFEYTYDGETYTSERMYPATFTPDHDTREGAEEVLEEYDTGATVTAYVNPGSPGGAFLKDETTKTPLVIAVLGTVMSLIAGASVVRSFG